jgi:hypothetical protein
VYILWQWQKHKQDSTENAHTGCMYWADSCYKEIACNTELKDRVKLPLDLEKMKSFKRIMREDTITEKSIGKIYYIKTRGIIEYYTEGGNHPIDVTRSLRKLSAYMFNQYLGKDRLLNGAEVIK